MEEKSIIIIGNQASSKAFFPFFPWQIAFFGSDFPILVSKADKEIGMGMHFPAPTARFYSEGEAELGPKNLSVISMEMHPAR